MLSWVWQGVCRALIAMEPREKVELCSGVRVTFWQSLPPMMSRGRLRVVS